MINLVIWSVTLLAAIIISTFIHELGHGFTHYLSGRRISTGFNKVGDLNKKPSHVDFRNESTSFKTVWDLGVPVTLLLAVFFTFVLSKADTNQIVLISGAFAISNSLLRLIPCCNSILGLIRKGKLTLEDEIGLGCSWKETLKIPLLEYLPLIISLLVSIYTFRYSMTFIIAKADWLFKINFTFTLSTIITFILSGKILGFLDERFRINWGK